MADFRYWAVIIKGKLKSIFLYHKVRELLKITQYYIKNLFISLDSTKRRVTQLL